MLQEYNSYLSQKLNDNKYYGFEPTFFPDKTFDFQKKLIEWSIQKGRCAIFADCGLGKSLIELSFAQNIIEKTNGNVLLLTPIAVGIQMEKEAEKFGIDDVRRTKNGKIHSKITITNYEQLHHFNASDFDCVICDESSILKNFNGAIKHDINIFMRKVKYRLLATATAAPNDYIELGTSSEALGYYGYMDMLNKFFVNDQNSCNSARRGRFTEEIKWRLKGHAHDSFWRWITSWARAIRFPSDLGFSDEGYILPELITHEHILDITRKPASGMFFSPPAVGLKEQRDERRETIRQRCEKAAELADKNKDFSTIWCNLNDEGDLLEKIIPGSVQISGKDSNDAKEEKLIAFSNKQIKKLITKPKIGAWGLNWQHCNHIIYFPTHSYEQEYQLTRRCWRFGQTRKVIREGIYTKGDIRMIDNLKRKGVQAEEMFKNLIAEMNNSLTLQNKQYSKKMELPTWL